MRNSSFSIGLALILVAGVVLSGCGDKKSNPISAFSPEIINTADAFQFQITDASNVTTTVTYPWNNASTQATINHSTVTNSGSATVSLFDADTTLVYTSNLAASLNETSSIGTAGVWTVQVSFVNFSGTANFRVQRL